MLPLPIVPSRYAGEAMSCWLERVGALYDHTAGELLDEWLVPLETGSNRRQSVEERLTDRAAVLASQRLRLPVSVAGELLTGPPGWVVSDPNDVAVCPRCLLADDLNHQPRYRRIEWACCWRVTCVTHRCPLLQMPKWRTTDVACLVGTNSRRTALGRRLPSNRTRAARVGPPIGPAIAAVREIERVIEAALNGRRPRQARWGDIDSEGFGVVVRDVSSFLLTNFSPRSLPAICTADAGRFADPAPVGFFTRRAQPWSPWTTCADALTLANAGDVGLRRCALFWTQELMHANSARPWIDPILRASRSRRLSAILERQCSAGLEWLSARVTNWPAEYRQSWWSGMRLVGAPPEVVDAIDGHL